MMTLEIPVEYTKRAPRMEILETSVNTVNLKLSGSGLLIRATRPEQVQVKLNLEKAVAGRSTFTRFTTPAGILAFSKISKTARAHRGVVSAGLSAIVQPAANAGATLRVIMEIG